MACHHAIRSIWVYRWWHFYESFPRDPLRMLRDSLQLGHLLPLHRRQVHLPSWHQARFAWSRDGWKETRVGLCKACFHVPHFVDHHSSGQKIFTVFSLRKSNIYTKKRCIAKKKVILTVRAIMIGQQIDTVAGDFNGTAWRNSKRDNISTIDEAFVDCAFQRRRALHLCGDPDRFQTTGLTSVGSLNCSIQIGIGRCACMVLPPSHAKLSACVQPIKAAIMRHGPSGFRRLAHHSITSWRAWQTNSPQETSDDMSLWATKTRISEVVSDHSLSLWPCDHAHVFVNPMRNQSILT